MSRSTFRPQDVRAPRTPRPKAPHERFGQLPRMVIKFAKAMIGREDAPVETPYMQTPECWKQVWK